MNQPIAHDDAPSGGMFSIQVEGERVAEMVYSRISPSLISIDHTEVAPPLGGQGIAHSLLQALVAWARATHTKVIPRCSFAQAQFDKDPAIRDVLA